MAKLSISIPDDLVDDLHAFAAQNVSAFVTLAIRHEVDRQRLLVFLDELEDELGPAEEDEVAAYTDALWEIAAPRARERRQVEAGRAGSRAAP